MKRIVACVVMWLGMALASGGVLAQSNLGEVMDKGGTKLSKQDLHALIPGALWQSTTASGIAFKIDMKADQTLVGTGTNAKGSGPVTGSWAINDQGQLCTKTLIVNFRQTTEACVHVFKLGSDYFGSVSDRDRAAPASRRTYTK